MEWVLVGAKYWIKEYRWIILILIVMINAGYFIIMHITPYDVGLQIKTALLRVMMHSAGLALIFSSEVLGRSFKETKLLKSDT